MQGSTDAARRLVLEHGWNSTSHQVLDPGMRRWFSAASAAVVGYVQVARVRAVAGAPVAARRTDTIRAVAPLPSGGSATGADLTGTAGLTTAGGFDR